MPADAARDPVEWAQHTALVAISVARTVLDLAEAAVADRERLERLATTGRSFAETWLGDAARVASTVVSGFGFDSDAAHTSAPPTNPAAEAPAAPPTTARPSGPTVAKRPAKRAAPRPRTTPTKKKASTARKATAAKPKPRKK
jgi:hypothetical protein